jgi:hypothetical protein
LKTGTHAAVSVRACVCVLMFVVAGSLLKGLGNR